MKVSYKVVNPRPIEPQRLTGAKISGVQFGKDSEGNDALIIDILLDPEIDPIDYLTQDELQ